MTTKSYIYAEQEPLLAGWLAGRLGLHHNDDSPRDLIIDMWLSELDSEL